MDNTTTIINQNIINVDIDSRAVTLPVNFNLGVMYDNSCKTITFMVKKKSDITDLTDLTFSINTISAKGTPDKLECDTREEGGFYIITAVLKGTIFEASGKATFNLCGQKFDSSYVVIKSWGSEDITALVGSHSHADKAIEELYPSVLEELRQKVNNPNLTDEQLNSIATKVAEKGFYTKSEIDNMIANIVVPTRLSQLADDTTHRLVTDEEKAKWNALKNVNVVTEVTDENYESEDPIAVKAVVQEMLMFESAFELKEVSMFSQFNLIGLDTNKLNVITKAWNDELQYTELWFVFYGRENNKDDTLADADGDDSISVNGVTVLEVPLAYIRKRGTYFYTIGHFKLVGEFVFGTVAICDGNGTNNTITVEPVQATKIDDIIINTSNLFKGDSKFAVYAR